jgi:cell division protein FtsL
LAFLSPKLRDAGRDEGIGMLRLLSVAAMALTGASAFGLYQIKYDTRQLEAKLQAGERSIEKMEGDIAVLKAEKAYLARPERIEALAKKQGLGPIAGTQYVLPAELEAQLKAGGQDTSVAKAGKATLSQPDRIEALLRQQDSLAGETR